MVYKKHLKNICSVSNGFEEDRFVGIKVTAKGPEIHFPIGFNISSNDKEIRRDTALLINILKRFLVKDEINFSPKYNSSDRIDIPIFACQRMILRYLNYGKYSEIENYYDNGSYGKINWARTIKKCIPNYGVKGAVYLDYVVKKSKVNEDTLISLIYDYCVYCSFEYIGWLYTNKPFPKPDVRFNKKLFLSAITKKLNNTNSDIQKQLFYDMFVIIKNQDDMGYKYKDYIYGTYEFEYVWEKLIDSAYGIKNKDRYFPRSYWHLVSNDGLKANHALEPDTIMVKNNAGYILDAKYYKYGYTAILSHLPETSSIQKQITYGEYLYRGNFGFSEIFNAFLMPADLTEGAFKCKGNLRYIGYADTDWKSGHNLYEKVAGILVDTKYLMSNYTDKMKISDELSQLICYNIKY